MAACIDTALRSSSKCTINPYNSINSSGQCQTNKTPLCRSSFKFYIPTTFFNCGTPRPAPEKEDDLWCEIREEARFDAEKEPILLGFYCTSILAHDSLEGALASHLAAKLCTPSVCENALRPVFLKVFTEEHEIRRAAREDLKAVKERDPACIGYVHCLLNFKGFLACQSHRVANVLWSQGRKSLAVFIQSRVSEVFAVDIHPGARIGSGVLLDHATGIVIGETAVVGDNVSILHGVTLGGTGKVGGDRHPKVGNGVLIGAGSKILGNVVIGDEAKIGAGSVVLKEVPPLSTAVGNPARLVAGKGRL